MDRIEYELITKRYPFLTPFNRWTGKEPDFEADNRDYYTEITHLPEGWAKAFGYELVEELREECIKWDYLNELKLVQIKEKYGTLRIYTNAVPRDSKIYEIIDKYEALSEKTCIQCGSDDDVKMTRGYILPYCRECMARHNEIMGER